MKKIITIIACILSSALLFYFSDGIKGQYSVLQWLAPVPILLLSFYLKIGQVFIVSFIASFLGRLGWLSYLCTLMPQVPAVIVVTLLSLAFTLAVLFSRHALLKIKAWYAVFAFPVIFTTYEWLLISFSYDGSAASIAYSQCQLPALIQIASLTGILGITFIVAFIASFLSMAVYFRQNIAELLPLVITGCLIIVLVFTFGVLRLGKDHEGDMIPVALVVLDEDQHKFEPADNSFEIRNAENYASVINDMAKKGAKLVVFPERAINVNKETESTIKSILCTTAKDNGITIVAGYTNYIADQAKNSTWVIDETGKIICDYNKAHPVKGLESQFAKGNEIAIFPLNGFQGGVAICKDLDYPGYIRQYGRKGVTFLCIPAWDFSVDGWLHSRMAILRGVENGFSEVRAARTGRLTISDAYARITAEANSEEGKATELYGFINSNRIETPYSKSDKEWLGIACAIAFVLFIMKVILKKRSIRIGD